MQTCMLGGGNLEGEGGPGPAALGPLILHVLKAGEEILLPSPVRAAEGGLPRGNCSGRPAPQERRCCGRWGPRYKTLRLLSAGLISCLDLPPPQHQSQGQGPCPRRHVVRTLVPAPSQLDKETDWIEGTNDSIERWVQCYNVGWGGNNWMS